METNKKKFYTLDEMKDKFIGVAGTVKREAFEYELRMEIIEEMRKKSKLDTDNKKPFSN